MPNKTSTDGRFMGPCSIAKKWAPYEISIVSVPADPTVGVGRKWKKNSNPEHRTSHSISMSGNFK